MLNKIQNEIDNFTKTIKEAKGCDEMIVYANSSYISCVKLLMFASAKFSLYFRLMLFLVMASAGLLMSTLIGAIPFSLIPFLILTFLLFALILVFTSQSKSMLINSIENIKDVMQSNN